MSTVRPGQRSIASAIAARTASRRFAGFATPCARSCGERKPARKARLMAMEWFAWPKSG